MPVPKRKRSRARRDKRFANKGMEIQTITACKQCAAPQMPHQACKKCGFYKGRKVLATKVDRSIKRTETRKRPESQEATSQGAE